MTEFRFTPEQTVQMAWEPACGGTETPFMTRAGGSSVVYVEPVHW